MQFIKPRINLIEQEPGVISMLKHIEKAGRVSYKSEKYITNDSYIQFIEMLTKREHLSPLEHGTVYLKGPIKDCHVIDDLLHNPYITLLLNENDFMITTNYRVILENNMQTLMENYWTDGADCVPRLTYHIICSRGVSLELVRHRVFSFTQESTRYCDYSNLKNNKQLTFIIPSWVDDIVDEECFTKDDIEVDHVVKTLLEKKRKEKTMMLISNNVCCETIYMEMRNVGVPAEEARDILTNGLKTELMMTGTVRQWENFLKLRSPKYGASRVHPDMAVIADMIHDDLIKHNYIKPLITYDQEQE